MQHATHRVCNVAVRSSAWSSSGLPLADCAVCCAVVRSVFRETGGNGGPREWRTLGVVSRYPMFIQVGSNMCANNMFIGLRLGLCNWPNVQRVWPKAIGQTRNAFGQTRRLTQCALYKHQECTLLTKRSPRSKTNVTTVLSKDPEASRFPSQFHATECTLEECT